MSVFFEKISVFTPLKFIGTCQRLANFFSRQSSAKKISKPLVAKKQKLNRIRQFLFKIAAIQYLIFI